jgi:two-component system cell cycle response regulator CtrA
MAIWRNLPDRWFCPGFTPTKNLRKVWDMLVLRVGRAGFIRGGRDLEEIKARGLTVEHALSGRDGLEFLRSYDFDLLLVDVHLRDMPGHELVRLARAARFDVPAVILADTATPQAKARALDQGADDFIITPCDIEEMMARVRAVVRRSQGHARSVLRCGPVELSLDRREVLVRGQRLVVSRREFAVLELLFLRQGTILNKTAFLNHLYCGADEPEIKTIDVIICRLRKKLAAAGVGALVDTVWGCGYILREPTLPPDGRPDHLMTHPAAA